jgi:hypothetical protein
MSLPLTRFAAGDPVPVDNFDPYSAYRFIVTSVRDASSANSVQFAEIQFDGQVVGAGGSIPEPAAWALVLLALSMLAAVHRRASARRG